MSTAGKFAMGLAGALPMVGVVALALHLTLMGLGRSPTALMDLEARQLMALGGVVLAIALVQMAVAVVYIVHASKDSRLQTGQRIVWALGMLFFGELAMPIYWLLYVYRDPPPPLPSTHQLRAELDARYPL